MLMLDRAGDGYITAANRCLDLGVASAFLCETTLDVCQNRLVWHFVSEWHEQLLFSAAINMPGQPVAQEDRVGEVLEIQLATLRRLVPRRMVLGEDGGEPQASDGACPRRSVDHRPVLKSRDSAVRP